MHLTTTKSGDNTTTYGECFDYMERTLSGHVLLTQFEREECLKAIGTLKRIFKRFGSGKESG